MKTLNRILIIFVTAFVALLHLQVSYVIADSTVIDESSYVAETVLVKFKPGTPAIDKANIAASIGGKIERSYTLVPGLTKVVAKGKKVLDLIERLSKNPNIVYVEPDYIVNAEDTVPNDSEFNKLWGMTRIDAPTAWDSATGNPEYVVAVIDTGVDYTHPDLADNMWINEAEDFGYDGVDDDNNGFVDDIHGYDFVNNDGDPYDDHYHGTHVAGTIGAVGDNAIGVVGVNWNCKIMALKFLGNDGIGTTSGAIGALDYAVKMGVKLSNNSWGGGGYSQSLYESIDAAGNANHLFVAAAGNGGDDYVGDDNDSIPHYPSSYTNENIISVANITSSDTLSSSSNYGETSVDLAAPGSNIYSTIPERYTHYGDDQPINPIGYANLSGTSMATPHVTGAAALMAGQFPSISAMAIKDAILNTSEPLDSLYGKTITGGLLDVAAALASIDSIPAADFTFDVTNLDVFFTDASFDNDGTIAYWDWGFGDGQSSTLQNPFYTYGASGTYQVTLSVTDDDNNTNSITKEVTVTEPDTTPPVINAPEDVVKEATGVSTQVDLGTPTVSDNTDPNPEVTNDAPDGFAVGVTTVTWVATDSSNNSASDTQIVTIEDTTAPSITAPDDITVESSEPVAVNLGTPTVSDIADPNPVVSNDAPDLFPIGTTTVTWTATDASGNIATDPQTVTVNVPVLAGVISVADLDGSSDGGSKFWIAEASIEVNNTAGSAEGVTVAGVWSDGSNVSCVTDSSGVCSVNSRKSRKNSLTFAITDLSNGVDSYDPAANSDSDGNSDGTSITINRDDTIPGTTPPDENTDPVAQDDSATTEPGTSVTIDVLANDSDADEDSLSVTGVTEPGNGIAIYTSNDITYTPDTDFIDTDTFTYTVSDGNGGTASATVIVEVQEAQDLVAVYISDLSGEASGNNVKNVIVTITVNDYINNAAVSGMWSWSEGASGTASCTTSNGICSVNVRTKNLPVTFSVTDITGSNLNYDITQNEVNDWITVPQ